MPPAKLMEHYLAERKHLLTHPLSALADTRLGIDATHYLKRLFENNSVKEPLLAATGGLPLSLSNQVEADLRVLERLRIKPVFVFPGLVPQLKRWKHQHHLEHNEACRDRREAWSKYEAGQEDAATRLFDGKHGIVQWDVWRMVAKIFRHRAVEYIVAPYVAWAQMIYLQRHNKAYIHAMYAPTDALLYPGVDKIIVSLDCQSSTPTFTCTSKRAILSDFSLSEDQFLDVGILIGSENILPFPPTAHQEALKATVDMVKYFKTGHAAVSATMDHPAVKTMQYADYFIRTRSMVRFSLILNSDGSVVPLALALPPAARGDHHSSNHHHLTPSDIPNDLNEIFTGRLPDEIYFYLSRGLLNPQPLIWLTSGQIVENPPLDNGEITEYRRFVKEVITDGQTGPRATVLALISSVMHSSWATKKVAGQFWFDPSQQQPQGAKHHNHYVMHNSVQTSQLAERVASWNVPEIIVTEELRRQNSSTIDFLLCIGATASEKLAARTKFKNSSPNTPLDKKDELVANVIWRFLELRGFLINTHTHSSLARAMYVAVRHAKLNDKFQEPLYLFLELVRAGVMHGNLWSGRAFSGGPSFGTDEEKASMLLVMRVLSIVPLNFKLVPWSAPLSRELLVFNSFVRSLTRALRTLLEATSLNMLLRSDARRGRDDCLDITLSLPFQSEVNTGFGVLAKVYLDALTHINNGVRVRDANAEGVADAKALALEICEETFPGVKLPKLEVERGFRFWDVAMAAMRQLIADGAVSKDLFTQFEAADIWLAPMRP